MGRKAQPPGDGHGRQPPSRDKAIRRDRSERADRARLEHSADILESISDAFYALDADWRFIYVNSLAEEWWARDRGDVLGKVFTDAFPEAVDSPSYRAHLQAAETRKPVKFEMMSAVLQRWLHITIYPTAAGGLSVFFSDITERKRLEEVQAVLVKELEHRTRNLLGVLSSIFEATLRRSDNLDDFAASFRSRISALARVQTLPSRMEGQEHITFGELIRTELDAVSATDPSGRVILEGPDDVALPHRAVQILALSLHELATNATKYGALSPHQQDGRLTVRWRVAQIGSGPRLAVEWIEQGVDMGLVANVEKGSGYGRQLIERALPHSLGAWTAYEVHPDGVRCVVELPLRNDDEAVGDPLS